MARPVVIDSDLLIDFLRGTEPYASRVLELAQRSRALVSAVSVCEVATGLTDDEQDALRRQVSGRTLALDLEGALEGGRISRLLRSQGRSIGTPDELIAGTCLLLGLPLATRNRKHFERVPGLELIEV